MPDDLSSRVFHVPDEESTSVGVWLLLCLPEAGAPLFRSDSKFESGTGWPSFFNPLPGAITLHEDVTLGMKRVEVRSASSGIHLGHVFNDGPKPTGKRYCNNGVALRFEPAA